MNNTNINFTDNIDMASLVEKSLLYYDNMINNNKFINIDNIKVDRDKTTIVFPDIDNKIYRYEVLGVFDNMNNIWMWGWMVPEFLTNETTIVKKLLNYGLKINPSILNKIPDDKLYLKTQLVNSRFLLQDIFQLELHLAISCYLAKDNFKFIYSKKKYLSKDKKKYITVYYLIL
jgi:hypothetical protein